MRREIRQLNRISVSFLYFVTYTRLQISFDLSRKHLYTLLNSRVDKERNRWFHSFYSFCLFHCNHVMRGLWNLSSHIQLNISQDPNYITINNSNNNNNDNLIPALVKLKRKYFLLALFDTFLLFMYTYSTNLIQ